MEKISNCEEEIMSIVWSSDEKPDLKEIMERVNKKFDHQWKPQTVSTFLSRLVKNNFLTSERKGRVHIYTPVVSQEQYMQFITERYRNIFK